MKLTTITFQNEIILGEIVGVHGIKGELKVKSWTKPITNLISYKPLFMCVDKEIFEINIERSFINKNILVIKIQGLNDRTNAEKLIKANLVVESENLPKLQNEEVYWHQIIGLEVINQEKISFGIVQDLLETGSNDVLVVKDVKSVERLIPYIKQFVLDVDLNAKQILVDWDADF